jgi:hypothetical protein
MKIKGMFVVLLCCIVTASSSPAFAADFPSGAIIVPISDGLTLQAFNIKTDAASIYLEKAVLYKWT